MFLPLQQCSVRLIFVPKIDCLFSWGSSGVFITPGILFLPACAPPLSYFVQCYLIEMMIFFSEWNCLYAAEAMECCWSLVSRLLLVVYVPPSDQRGSVPKDTNACRWINSGYCSAITVPGTQKENQRALWCPSQQILFVYALRVNEGENVQQCWIKHLSWLKTG